ncbi:MAG: CHRD domain-containing protein [Gemmatimonadales bacterium]
MNKSAVRACTALLAIGAVVAACDDDDPTSVEEVESFEASLSGAGEVPSNASTATGEAEISIVGPTLLYRIDVTGLSNAVMAHIHGPAPSDQNAGILVNLCGTAATPACATGAPYTGVLTAGTASNVVGISFDSLTALLRNGNAYVNVHTNDNVGAQNTGPGDLAVGEIRGQIEPSNP